MNEEQVNQLTKTFLEQNPFANAAKEAYTAVSIKLNTDPIYLALMAIAFELWLDEEAN